jgi:hypothetical protein
MQQWAGGGCLWRNPLNGLIRLFIGEIDGQHLGKFVDGMRSFLVLATDSGGRTPTLLFIAIAKRDMRASLSNG